MDFFTWFLAFFILSISILNCYQTRHFDLSIEILRNHTEDAQKSKRFACHAG